MAMRLDRRRLCSASVFLLPRWRRRHLRKAVCQWPTIWPKKSVWRCAGEPLIVLVSLDGCVYCERVRRSNLLPRLASGQAMVQVNLRSNEALQDWHGRPMTHDALARQWRVKVTPTLLFLGSGGREVAERMEGLPARLL